MKKVIVDKIEKAYEVAKTHKFTLEEWQSPEWEDIKNCDKHGKLKDTGVSISELKDLGEKISTLPEDWDFHP